MEFFARVLLLSTLALGVAGAVAQPTAELIWSATTGSGDTGSNTINAAPGDYLTLDIVVRGGDSGLLWAAPSLAWDAGDLTAFNPQECPAPPNELPEVCGDPVSEVMLRPIVPGVTLGDSGAGVFDAVSLLGLPAFSGQAVTVGRIELLVESSASLETVRVEYDPLYPGLGDGLSQSHYPAAEAYILPPGC